MTMRSPTDYGTEMGRNKKKAFVIRGRLD